MRRKRVSVLVTDLDNTLFNWVDIWHEAFSAMLRRLVEDSGISRDRLIKEIKGIHERHGTSEYAFLIEELPSLQEKHPGKRLAEVYSGAIDAFRHARKAHLRLYPGVMGTLGTVKQKGCLIVAYTESLAFYTNYRIRNLGLDGVLDYLYSPADHDLPANLTREQLRNYPPEHYDLKGTEHRNTPAGQLKPNPKILLQIIRDIRAEPNQCIYIGDSLIKDVAMAKEAGVTDVYALYGDAQKSKGYELLRQVTHWTQEQVEQEKRVSPKDMAPTYTLTSSLSEIVDLFDFEAFKPY